MNFKPFKLKTRINNWSDWAWCSGYGGQRWGSAAPHIRAAEVAATSLATTSQMTQLRQERVNDVLKVIQPVCGLALMVDPLPTYPEHGLSWAVLQSSGSPSPASRQAHPSRRHLLSDSTGHTCDGMGLVGALGAEMSKTGRCAL